MTSLIRSARLAAEIKTVPVPGLQAEVRKIPIQIQARAYGQPSEQVTQAPTVATAPAPPSAPVVPTYEEYKQRSSDEIAALRQQAAEEGREEGFRQGRQSAEAHHKQQLETLRVLIESARDARERYIEDIGDDAVEIVLVAITKILGAGFVAREAAVAAVREAIRCCKQRGRIVVKVAPQDFELLNARLSELTEGATAREIELIADEQVKWGGCVLEGASGNLDARLETQVQRLCDTLVGARVNWAEPQGTSAG